MTHANREFLQQPLFLGSGALHRILVYVYSTQTMTKNDAEIRGWCFMFFCKGLSLYGIRFEFE